MLPNKKVHVINLCFSYKLNYWYLTNNLIYPSSIFKFGIHFRLIQESVKQRTSQVRIGHAYTLLKEKQFSYLRILFYVIDWLSKFMRYSMVTDRQISSSHFPVSVRNSNNDATVTTKYTCQIIHPYNSSYQLYLKSNQR